MMTAVADRRWQKSLESLLSPRPFYRIFHESDLKKRVLYGDGWLTANSAVTWTMRKKVEPTEKKRKSLKLNRKEVDWWDSIGEERDNKLSRKYIPKNTATTTKWALSNFNVWKHSRNKRIAGDCGKCCPDDILESTNSEPFASGYRCMLLRPESKMGTCTLRKCCTTYSRAYCDCWLPLHCVALCHYYADSGFAFIIVFWVSISFSLDFSNWSCSTANWVNKLIINYQRLYPDIGVNIWSFINYQC